MSRTTTRTGPGSLEGPGPITGIAPAAAPSRFVAIVAILAVVVFGSSLWFQRWSSSRPVAEIAGSTAVSAQTFEARYGMRVSMLGVIAAGGLLNLRLVVVDPVKAAQLFDVHLQRRTGHTHGDAIMPALVPDGSGRVMNVAGGMSHHVSLVAGQSINLLYPNPEGSIQADTVVSVVFDDVRLDGIVAQF